MTDADRGQVAATAADVYEQFFLPALFEQWADPILDAAGVAEGDHVLDVGCGTGVVARSAVSRVGNTGSVTGVDPNEGMLTVARRHDGIEWREGFAEKLPFEDDSFDAVVSQFAMMFFTDPKRAIGEFARVGRGGSRVAVATWAPLHETPGYAAVVAILDRLFGKEAADALRAPYHMGDREAIEALFSEELVNVEVLVREGVARFESIEDWVYTDIKGWTLADMPDDDFERFSSVAQEELKRFTDDRGRVSFPAPAVIATGMVPE